MGNYYNYILGTIDNLPRIKQTKSSVRKMAKPLEFANNTIKSTVYGEKNFLQNQETPQLKLIEGFFRKMYKGNFKDIPFFTKIIKTSDKTEERTLKILRSDERGFNSETTVAFDGIRISKLTKQSNPDGSSSYKRYSYNTKGTKPRLVSFWIEDK